MVTKHQEFYKIEVGHTLKMENLSFDFSFPNRIGPTKNQTELLEEITRRISSNNICPTSILRKNECALLGCGYATLGTTLAF